MADKGLRVKGKTYKSISEVPEQYRAQWEAGSRQKDPGNVNPNIGPNAGRTIVPHVTTFSGIVSTLAKTYRNHDEAIRHNVQNAHMMRRDPMIMGPLLARQRAVALLNWSVEPEDKTSEVEVRIAKELTKMISMIPRFTEYRRNLLEAVWYGRYAIQHKWSFVRKGGAKGKGIIDWVPVHGDKIMFRYDDGTGKYDPNEIGIKVSPAHVKNDIWAGKPELEYNTEGSAVFLRKWERSRLALHKHLIMDGDYEDPTTAGMIHGVGLRHFLYWAWFQKQETLAQLAEIVERTGMGFTIYYYPAGNEQARAKVEEVAEDQAHKNQIIMPYDAANPGSYGIDQVQPVTAGIPALTNLLDEYWGSWIIRFILGQTLSMRDGGGGLGTGTADLHKESFLQIIEYDAHALDETLTQDLVRMYVLFNYPSYRHINFKFKSHTEKAVPLEKLQSIQAAWSMGAKVKAADVMDLVGMTVAGEEDDALYNPQLAIALKQFRETMNQDREQQVAEELAQQQSKEKESVQRYSKLYAKRAPVPVRRPSRKAPKGFTVGGEASKRKDSSFKPPKEMVYKDPEKNSKDGAGPGDHKDSDWDTTWKQLMGDLTGLRGEMPEEAYGSAGIAAAQKYMPRDPGDKENPDYKYNLQYQEEGDEPEPVADQTGVDTRAILGEEPEPMEATLARLQQEDADKDDAASAVQPKAEGEMLTGASYGEEELAQSRLEQEEKETDLGKIMKEAGLAGEESSGTIQGNVEAQFTQKPESDFDESSSIRLGIIRHLTDLHPEKEQPKQLIDKLTTKELDTLTTSGVISRAKSAIQELHKKEGRVTDLSKLKNESDVDKELEKYPADVRSDVKSMFARIPTPDAEGNRVKPEWSKYELMSPDQIEVAKQLANAESATEFFRSQGKGDLVSQVLSAGTREKTGAIMGRDFSTPEAKKLVAELNNPEYLHASMVKGMGNYNHITSELDKFIKSQTGRKEVLQDDRWRILESNPDVTISHPRVPGETITIPFKDAVYSLQAIRESVKEDRNALADANLDKFDEETAGKFRDLWGGLEKDYSSWSKKTGDQTKAGYTPLVKSLPEAEVDADAHDKMMDKFHDIDAGSGTVKSALDQIGEATPESIKDIPGDQFAALYMIAQEQNHENASLFEEDLARRNEESKSAAARAQERASEKQKTETAKSQELAASEEIVPETEEPSTVVAGIGEDQFSEMNYEEKRDHVDSLLESIRFSGVQKPEAGVQSLSESELEEMHSDILSEVESDIARMGNSRTTKKQLEDLADKYGVDVSEFSKESEISSAITESIKEEKREAVTSEQVIPEAPVTEVEDPGTGFIDLGAPPETGLAIADATDVPSAPKTELIPAGQKDAGTGLTTEVVDEAGEMDQDVLRKSMDMDAIREAMSGIETSDLEQYLSSEERGPRVNQMLKDIKKIEDPDTRSQLTAYLFVAGTPGFIKQDVSQKTKDFISNGLLADLESKISESMPPERVGTTAFGSREDVSEPQVTRVKPEPEPAGALPSPRDAAFMRGQEIEDLKAELTQRGIKFLPGESRDELKKRLEAGVSFTEFTDAQIGKMDAKRLRALLTEANKPFASNASVGELRKELKDHRDDLIKADEEAKAAAAQVDEGDKETADYIKQIEDVARMAEVSKDSEEYVQGIGNLIKSAEQQKVEIAENVRDYRTDQMVKSLVDTWEERNPGKQLYTSEIAERYKVEENIASHLSDYQDALVGLGSLSKLHRHAVSVMYGGGNVRNVPLEALRRASNQAEYVIDHVVTTRPEELIQQLVGIRADALESKASQLLEEGKAKAIADLFGVPLSDVQIDPVTGSSNFDKALEANTLEKWRRGSGTEEDPYQYFDIDEINKELQDAYESKARRTTPPPGADPQAARAGAPPVAGTDFADVKLSTERSSLLEKAKDRIQRKGRDGSFLISDQQLEDGAKGFGFVSKEELGKLNRSQLESKFAAGLERKLKQDQLVEDHGIDESDPKFAEYKLLARQMGFEGNMADRVAKDRFVQEKAGDAILAKNKAESEAIIAKNVENTNYKDWVSKRSALVTMFGDAMIGTTGRKIKELPEFNKDTMAQMDSNVLATAEKYLGFNPNEDRFQRDTVEETKKAQVEGAFEHLKQNIDDMKGMTKQYSDFMNSLGNETATKLAGDLGLNKSAMLEFGEMPLHKQAFVASKLLNHAAVLGGHKPDRTKGTVGGMADSIDYLLNNRKAVENAMRKEYGSSFAFEDLNWKHITLIIFTLLAMSTLSAIGRSR